MSVEFSLLKCVEWGSHVYKAYSCHTRPSRSCMLPGVLSVNGEVFRHGLHRPDPPAAQILENWIEYVTFLEKKEKEEMIVS